MARRNGSLTLSVEVVAVVCALCLGGASARVLQESSPATYAPSTKIALVESPYYLPGITNQSETVPAVPGVSEAKAFRIMGAPEGPKGSSSFALTFENAYKACQDVGLGMASLLDDAHKAAADRLIQHSIYVNPDDSNTTKGCCSGFVWAAGYRVDLSDAKCVGEFPYFTISPNSTVGTGYQGCGKDPLKDWVWRVTDANNQVTNVSWSSIGQPEKWWYNDANVGDSQGDPQPTGWNGPFNLQPYPDGGSYENCTAIKMLERDGTVSGNVKPEAYGVSWYNDFGCEAPLARWICEFTDDKQGVTKDVSNKTLNSLSSPLTKSFFYIPGVTDDAQPSTIGTQVYRVMGITPDKAALLRSTSGPGVNGSVTWKDAQSVCIYNGGTGLASFETGATQSAARNQLLARLGSKLSNSPLWIGAAFFDIPATATIGQPSLWKWFTAYSTKNINSSATVPATGSHWQWGDNFPSAEPQYVNSAYGNNISAGEPTSCMAVVRDGSSDHWENRQCDAKDVTLFICAFSSKTTGFDPPVPEDSGSDTNVGAIVGGVIGGIALLAICAGLVAFFLLKRRKAAKAAEEEKKRAVKAAEEERKWSKFPSNRAMGDTFTHANADTIDPECWQKAAPNKTFTDTRNSTDFMMTDTHATSTAAGTLRNGTTDDGPSQSASTNPASIKARTHAIIDAFANRKVKFHEQYRLLPGPQNRREGGQGVVVFATSKFNSDQWAVKFFASYRHFKEERAMYEDPILAKVLPEIRDIVDTHEQPMQSPQGFPVPPFVIMGQGQPFDEWVASISPDFPLALQVLLHLAKKLQQIHQQGFAHRDVKPSNVILDSRTKQWVLIDFASAAPIGSVSSLSYSLHYAPPELAQALEAKATRMPVSGALDVWALGIMAWTLLTGIPPYDNFGQIMDKLLGRAKFPWESPLTKEVRQKLGILAPSVLSMLNRDPMQRATVDELLAKWSALFHGTTTDTADDADTSQLAVQSNAGTETRTALTATTQAKSTLDGATPSATQPSVAGMDTTDEPKPPSSAAVTEQATPAPVAPADNTAPAVVVDAAPSESADAPAAAAADADGAVRLVEVVEDGAPVSGFLAPPPVVAADGATDAPKTSDAAASQ